MNPQRTLEDILPGLQSAVLRAWEQVPQGPVLPERNTQELLDSIRNYSFTSPRDLAEVIEDVAGWLHRWTVHTTHPRYFGLFNPSVHAGSIAADALAAAYNPQLAVWTHSPAANEIENHVLRFFMNGYGMGSGAGGHFTSGGSEANTSAVAAALHHAFPDLKQTGVRGLPGDPVMYISEETHHSFHKTVSVFGLGESTLRQVPADDQRRLQPAALREMIQKDRSAGRLPFMVVATAGTTTMGIVDPLEETAAVCREQDLWYHVDAAWGGFAFMAPSLTGLLDGIHHADSITCDAHKGFSVSMGAGILLAKDRKALERAFGIDASYVTSLITRDGTDTFNSSLQWSRRFIGLKVFMTLAELGAEGMARHLDHQVRMGEALRDRLKRAGWQPIGHTRLPLVCFTHERIRGNREQIRKVLQQVYRGRNAWISEATAAGEPALRACITSWRTQTQDLEILIEELDRALIQTA